MSTITSRQKWLIAITFSGLLILVLLVSAPIVQNPDYHALADNRQWFGIANFVDIISNLPFAIIGIMGLFLDYQQNRETSISWQTFFVGLICVAIGSSYYHLNPNNQTLVWDRLPMMISFMSLFVALLTENISAINEKGALPVAILLGFSSVIYWHYSGDLRLYGFMQFAPLAAIPLLLYVYDARYTHRHYLLYGLLLYVLAKVFELTDRFVFEFSGEFISGHTIKHLLASAATYCIYLMLNKRQLINRQS